MIRADEREDLRRWLDALYARYQRPEFIGSDPVQFVHRYHTPADREVAGLVASSLAYGNVTSIHRSVDNVLGRMSGSPAAFLVENKESVIRRSMAGFRHRWTGEREIANLLVAMRRIIGQAGGLGAFFAALDHKGGDIGIPLAAWVAALRAEGGRGDGKDLLPDPSRKSACKRLHLYLRWMVRCDAIDAGCWPGIDPARLVMPLDTHVFGFARRCRFTRRRVADAVAAREITDVFATLCPEDPVRYDFCLTRPGIIDGWRPGSSAPWREGAGMELLHTRRVSGQLSGMCS